MVTSSLLPCGLRDWTQAIWLGSRYFNLLAIWQVPKYLLWQTFIWRESWETGGRAQESVCCTCGGPVCFLLPMTGGLQPPAHQAPGDLMPSFVLHGHLHTYAHTHKHTDTLIIKIILRRKLTLDGCLAAMYHIKTMELVMPVLADQLTNLNYVFHVLIRLLGAQGFQWPKIWLLWRWFQR